MSLHAQLYQYSEVYDVIFDRDVSREVDFLLGLFHERLGHEPDQALELCCGPGYYARALYRRGIATTGLDLSPEMIALARSKTGLLETALQWVQGDMRSFQLEAPVELAFCLFSGIQSLLSDDELVQHLRAVRDNLKPGGLYVVELSHPRDYMTPIYMPCYYSGQREGIQAELVWGCNTPPIDLVKGAARVEVELRVQQRHRQAVYRDMAEERVLMPAELRLLSRLAGGLEIVGWYGDFHLDQPLDNSPQSHRMLVVLQRTAGMSQRLESPQALRLAG